MSELLSLMKQSLSDSIASLSSAQDNAALMQTALSISQTMVDILNQGGKLMAAGNGGSACQAMHFAEELSGRYRKDRRALGALSLTDSSHITCVGNDFGFEYIFSRAVEAYGQAGDGLLVLSTSGNSENLIQAVKSAKEKNIQTFAMLGRDGGKLKGLCDAELIVTGATSDIIQNTHMVLIHVLIETLERVLFPENYVHA